MLARVEADARDAAVKKEALRRAGIGYVEVVRGGTSAKVRELVRKLAGRVPQVKYTVPGNPLGTTRNYPELPGTIDHLSDRIDGVSS